MKSISVTSIWLPNTFSSTIARSSTLACATLSSAATNTSSLTVAINSSPLNLFSLTALNAMLASSLINGKSSFNNSSL